MFGHIANQVSAKRAQLWADRIDLDGLVRFFNEKHPEKTAANVAALTEYPVATVRKWLSREVVPNGIAITVLYLTYGPELLHAVVRGAPDWLSATVRDRELAAHRATLAATREKIERLERA